MKTMRTEIAELTYDETENILHIRMLEGADMTLERTQEHYRIIDELTEGKKYLALVDANEYFTIAPEALRFASLPETTKNRVATAHYNPTFGNKLTADFFRKYYKPALPVRIFATKEEAITWLKLQEI